MANVRPKDLPNTATSSAGDDYLVVDGATNGTRKILSSNVVQRGASGEIAVTAAGSNQNITLTPSGTGLLQVNGPASVTGTLSATSLTTITSDSSANALFLLGRSSDNISQLQFRNNANNAIYGFVQATSAGGGTVNFLAQGATGTIDLYVNNTLRASANGTGLDVTGEVRGDSLRIDAAPSVSAATTTHKLAVNLNGTTYYLLLSNV